MNTNTSPTLTGLPVELLEQIASLTDIRTFRLVCRTLRVQSNFPFAERFFRTRYISLAGPESLLNLVFISEQPQLASAIRKLVIDATPTIDNRHAELNWQIEMARNDSGLQGLLKTQRDLLEKERQSMSGFLQDNSDRKLLATAFSNLPRLESISFAYDGIEDMNGKSIYEHLHRRQNEISRPFISTIQALCSVSHLVEDITIEDGRRHGAVSVGRLERLAPLLSEMGPVLSHLRVLHLDMRDWRNPMPEFEPYPRRTSFAFRFLAQAVNLRELDFSYHSRPALYIDEADSIQLPYLVKCTLSWVRGTDILRILQSSKQTLRNFGLRAMTIDKEDLVSVIEYLADSFALETFSMSLVEVVRREDERIRRSPESLPSAHLEAPDLNKKMRTLAQDYYDDPVTYYHGSTQLRNAVLAL